MRNDRVLILVLLEAQSAKCIYVLCILVFSSTTIGQLYFIILFGFYAYKVERSRCGFNRKRGLAETVS